MYKLTIGSSQISYNLVIPAATKLRIWNLILVEILEMSSKIEDIWPLYVSWYFCHMIVYLQWNRYFLNKSRLVILFFSWWNVADKYRNIFMRIIGYFQYYAWCFNARSGSSRVSKYFTNSKGRQFTFSLLTLHFIILSTFLIFFIIIILTVPKRICSNVYFPHF